MTGELLVPRVSLRCCGTMLSWQVGGARHGERGAQSDDWLTAHLVASGKLARNSPYSRSIFH